MKYSLAILVTVIILSCKKPKHIQNYPKNAEIHLFYTEQIDLDTTKLNFKAITNWVSENDHNNKLSLIEIEDDNKIRRIYPRTFLTGYFHEKNIIKISLDSILKNEGYPISELQPVLEDHLLNIKNNYPYSKFPQYAMVTVSIDTSQNASQLKVLLKKITQTYDAINLKHQDSLELILYFDYFRQIAPPPPPPTHSR